MSAIARCMLIYGGSGIGGYVVVVMMMVWIVVVVMAIVKVAVMFRKNLSMCVLGSDTCSVGSGGGVNRTDFKFIGKIESQTNNFQTNSVLAHFL